MVVVMKRPHIPPFATSAKFVKQISVNFVDFHISVNGFCEKHFKFQGHFCYICANDFDVKVQSS